jgi:hypothetical protein
LDEEGLVYSPLVFPLYFSGWVDPPISFDVTRFRSKKDVIKYYMHIMQCGIFPYIPPYTLIPYITFAPPSSATSVPPGTPPTEWEFYCDGVKPGDIEGDYKYYMTMEVDPSLPGGELLRHRVFIDPSAASTLPPARVFGPDKTSKTFLPFQVRGIPDDDLGSVDVNFQQYIITDSTIDPSGAPALFLQQKPPYVRGR